MILHIPHSARTIPETLRGQILLSDEELAVELTLMTDAFTDELFAIPAAKSLRFPISRLLVDVERFADDAEEPMSRVGMGKLYTRTSEGKPLRRPLTPEETEQLMSEFYTSHHRALLTLAHEALEQYGQALIIDCHSFPSRPLGCDIDKSEPRPDFCLGTDTFHTPLALAATAELELKKRGYSVRVNQPYEGTIVPMSYYGKDRRVTSLMIEVNRALYMDEISGAKNSDFDSVKRNLQEVLHWLKKSHERTQAS